MNIQKITEIDSSKKFNPLDAIEIDLTHAEKITLPKLSFKFNENAPAKLSSDFEIISEKIAHIKTVNRPKGFKAYKINDLKILRFIRYSDFISNWHPYITFDDENIDYIQIPKEIPLAEYFSHFKQSKAKNAYLVCFSSQNISLYDDKLNFLQQLSSSVLCKDAYHLRAVELNNELSLFCLTCVDKAFLLNKDFEIFRTLKVPYKDGFERRMVGKSNLTDSSLNKYYSVLQLNSSAKQTEIKSAFRKLIYQYHPDRNPDLKEAEEKARELIIAYEFLSGQDVNSALDLNKKEEYYWVDKKYYFEREVNGVRIEINLSMEKPEDWIYGLGFSNDSSKIYLGCFSGKLYETDLNGFVNKIYIVPEDENNEYGGTTNPINYIFEVENIKYILSHYYLYILENNNFINHIERNIGKIRWFDSFIVNQFEKELVIFDKRGFLLGKILFKTPIKYVCYKERLMLVELTDKTITFKIS